MYLNTYLTIPFYWSKFSTEKISSVCPRNHFWFFNYDARVVFTVNVTVPLILFEKADKIATFDNLRIAKILKVKFLNLFL